MHNILYTSVIKLCTNEIYLIYCVITHHFVVDLVEMNLAYFIDNILALERNKAKTCNENQKQIEF